MQLGWLVLRPASRMNCRSPYDPSHGDSGSHRSVTVLHYQDRQHRRLFKMVHT